MGKKSREQRDPLALVELPEDLRCAIDAIPVMKNRGVTGMTRELRTLDLGTRILALVGEDRSFIFGRIEPGGRYRAGLNDDRRFLGTARGDSLEECVAALEVLLAARGHIGETG